MIEIIRKKAVTDEFDYYFLLSCLNGLKHPRDKITHLLRSGAIIRVKKGLYVFGPEYSRRPFSRESLANLIYGPSYVSLEYALSFYGMIPEKIEMVTSVTNKRNKFFETPIGNFSYSYLSTEKYSEQITQVELDEFHNVLMAGKEKALADKLYFLKEEIPPKEMFSFLTNNLRIEMETLKELDVRRVKRLMQIYKNKNISVFYEMMVRLK